MLAEELRRIRTPAMLRQRRDGERATVVGWFLIDDDGRILRLSDENWGALAWQPLPDDVAEKVLGSAAAEYLHAEPDTGADSGSDAGVSDESIVWWVPDGSMLPLSARTAGQPLHSGAGKPTVPRRSGPPTPRIALPSRGAGGIIESGAWAQPGSVVLWRFGDERGAGLVLGSDPHFHLFASTWTVVDPAMHGAADVTGATVGDYLGEIVEEGFDEEPWTRAFRLDAQRAERLRVVLRSRDVGPEIFSKLMEVVGLPMELADLVEDRLAPHELDDHRVVEPAGLWRTIVGGLAELNGSSGYFWHRFATKRPRLWISITGTLILLSIVLLVLRSATGGLIVLPVVSIVVWTTDLLLGLHRFRWQARRRQDP